MRKSFKKSLYICAAALMVGGVAAPIVSNGISASAHSCIAISKYNHKKSVHKYNTKRMAHLRNIHRYHLRLKEKAERNLAKHKKSLARYNHLIHIHKHNRKMINKLTRAKNKLIKMIKADQHGITRQAKLVESEEHKINLVRKHAKQVNTSKRKNGRYGGKRYSYWFSLGNRHLSRYARRHLPSMNHWERRAFIAGVHKYNSNLAINHSQYNKLFNVGYSAGFNGKQASPYGNKQAKEIYESGYTKGLAKFIRNLKTLHNEATINHTQYLSSIDYAAGFDDGYHNDVDNQNNPKLIKLFNSWTGNSKVIFIQGVKAGQKARIDMGNRKNEPAIPNVIIPNIIPDNFNKVVKPTVIPNPNANQNKSNQNTKLNNWFNLGKKDFMLQDSSSEFEKLLESHKTEARKDSYSSLASYMNGRQAGVNIWSKLCNNKFPNWYQKGYNDGKNNSEFNSPEDPQNPWLSWPGSTEDWKAIAYDNGFNKAVGNVK